MKSYTHPDSGAVTSKSTVNTVNKSSLGIGKSRMNGAEISDDMNTSVVANPKGSNKTQEQKMQEAGIDLKSAGLK